MKNIAIINFETLKKKKLVPRIDNAEEPYIAGNVMIPIRPKSEDKLVVWLEIIKVNFAFLLSDGDM